MKEDKHIEKFTKDIINEIGLEKPSSSFLNNVMDAVQVETKIKAPVYKPLISKRILFLIAICFVGIAIWAFKFANNPSLFDKLGVNVNTYFNFNFLNGISISNPIIYALSIFGILVLIQIYLLKNNFDKQIGAL